MNSKKQYDSENNAIMSLWIHLKIHFVGQVGLEQRNPDKDKPCKSNVESEPSITSIAD